MKQKIEFSNFFILESRIVGHYFNKISQNWECLQN